MTVDHEYDYSDMAAAHSALARGKDIIRLVVAARHAFEAGTLPIAEQTELDSALEAFSAAIPYDEEPIE